MPPCGASGEAGPAGHPSSSPAQTGVQRGLYPPSTGGLRRPPSEPAWCLAPSPSPAHTGSGLGPVCLLPRAGSFSEDTAVFIDLCNHPASLLQPTPTPTPQPRLGMALGTHACASVVGVGELRVRACLMAASCAQLGGAWWGDGGAPAGSPPIWTAAPALPSPSCAAWDAVPSLCVSPCPGCK